MDLDCIVVDEAYSGMRLDAFLAAEGVYLTRSAAAKFVSEGAVMINGRTARKSAVVRGGDMVVYEVYQDPSDLVLQGQDIPLDVRYEDDHLLVISKQAGLVCHPAEGHVEGTLVNALINHCGRDHLCDVQGEGKDRLGIVHRLDRDTSGLMLAAKTNLAGEALMDAIRVRDVDRHYLALVHGWIPLDTGYIDAPIARHQTERMRMAISDREGSRQAVTTFSVLRRFEAGPHDEGYTLIDCKLYTGRTHQIRVHMEYIKHPCVGDPLYGWQKLDNLGLERQFLHSYKLAFTHPVTQERMEFEDTLPADLQEAISLLDARS